MLFKSEPNKKFVYEHGVIKFDSKGFYTTKRDEAFAFLLNAKGVELVKDEEPVSVETKPKRTARKSTSFIGD